MISSGFTITRWPIQTITADGDGVDDVFLATGAAWYYSPRGKAEWRYLAGGRTDRIESLLFGDFDGDGRTDVVGKNGNDLMVSLGRHFRLGTPKYNVGTHQRPGDWRLQ